MGCGQSLIDVAENLTGIDIDGNGAVGGHLEMREEPEFELSTPMVVVPFNTFKANGRILKSLKPYRDEAFKDGKLIEYAKVVNGTGKIKPNGSLDGKLELSKQDLITIFISHRWWDVHYGTKSTKNLNNGDRGAPDWMQTIGKHPFNDERKAQPWLDLAALPPAEKNIKWKIICAGVESLIEAKGLDPEKVVLWVDWMCIYQDDQVEKLRGIMSLIKVATLCDYMLVPTEEEAFSTFNGGKSVEDIPGYGVRGWCRLENFIFSLWSELKNREVALYAVTRNGKLQHHPKVKIFKGGMPHSGDFFHLNDSGHVVMLENTMIEKYGKSKAIMECKKGADERKVDLSRSVAGAGMIRAVHIDTLFKALQTYKIETLSLQDNELGDKGAASFAKLLPNSTLTDVNLSQNGIGKEGGLALAAAIKKSKKLQVIDLSNNGEGGDENGKLFGEEIEEKLRQAAGDRVDLVLNVMEQLKAATRTRTRSSAAETSKSSFKELNRSDTKNLKRSNTKDLKSETAAPNSLDTFMF